MRDRAADRRLMRYLHGELPAKDVRELRAELAKSPALQARLAELHRLWQGLQPSPPTPAPFGYLPKIQRLAEQQRATAATSVVGRGMAPWVGALAAAALVAGVALGVGLGRMPQKAQSAVAQENGAAATAASAATAPAGESVGAFAVPSTAVGHQVAASPSASPPLPSTTTPPRTLEAAAPTQRESSSTPSATDVADAIAGDESVALAGGGSTTLADEYWQALEGLDSGGDGGGGEGDAGW